MPTLTLRDDRGAEYAIHLSCPWQLVERGRGVITGNLDVYQPAFEPDGNFDWHAWNAGDWEKFDGNNRYDDRMRSFFSRTSDRDRAVTEITADEYGNCHIHFSVAAQIRI